MSFKDFIQRLLADSSESCRLNIAFDNTVAFVQYRDGKEIARFEGHNRVVNTGLEWIKDLVFNPANVATQRAIYIGLSSNANEPAAGDVDLGATIHTDSGLERAAATYASTGTGTFTLEHTFTCTSGPKTIRTAGLYFAAAGAGMFAGAPVLAQGVPAEAVLYTNDQIRVIWQGTMSNAA